MKPKSLFAIISVFSLIALISFSCGSRSNKGINDNKEQTIEVPKVNNTPGYGKSFQDNKEKDISGEPNGAAAPVTDLKISKVIFFIENSGSIRGYVQGGTQYVNVLTNIANHPDFVRENIRSIFYLTSGITSPIRVLNLRENLVPANFNQTRSNLNQLFKTTIDSASGNRIAILISDGIYDMCPNPTPLSTLQTLGHELRSIFISKLSNSNFQTILVKLQSNFNGMYYPGNCCSAYNINQQRPYYIWIFGETEGLKKYFGDEYLKSLNGYENSARFFKYNPQEITYKPNSHKLIGSFHPSSNDEYTLNNVKPNSFRVFQFSIAVDFSKLPLNDSYLSVTSNYKCTNGFKIVSIDPPTPVSRLGLKNQTHLIVVQKTGNPIGTLAVSVLNKGYPWISSTNISNDCNIRENTNQTFGFEVLNQGIIEAYNHFIIEKEIKKFNIHLKN